MITTERLKDITPEITIDFWHYMQKEYDLKTVKKSSSALMTFVRPFTGISKSNWQKFSTTLGHTLYTNIVPGDETQTSLLGQIMLISHECQHVIQYDKDATYSAKYLFSSAQRAHYEMEAYRVSMQLYTYMTGRALDIEKLILTLEAYKMDPGDFDVARKFFKLSQMTIDNGGVIDQPSQKAIAWLEERFNKTTRAAWTKKRVLPFERLI